MNESIKHFFVVLVFICASQLQSQTNNILFILDGSGSMWQKIEAEYKIAVAKTVMKDLVAKLPDGTRAGLVAYGHNRKSDCEDIETLVPLRLLDKAAFTAKLDEIDPHGMTPIAKSIQHTLRMLKDENTEVTIILVSDGLETCDGDACELVRQAKVKGAKITVHVIGFGMQEKDLSALECIAQAGNGQYLPANNSSDLADALDQTVEEVPQGDSYLSVRTSLQGELMDAIVKVFKKGDKDETIAGRTYSASTTNPRVFLLPSGEYEVEVSALKLDGSPVQKFADITLLAGDTLSKEVDFTNGIIEVLVTRNGELSDATVKVIRHGEKRPVSASRSYKHNKSNPVTFKVLPGNYDIEIGGLEIAGAPIKKFENQLLEGGGKIVLSHDYKSGGLKVGAKTESGLVDSTVKIHYKTSGKHVKSGRTYMHSKSNPKSFTLEPGIYKVEIKPLKPKGLTKKTIEVEIKAGESLERWSEW